MNEDKLRKKISKSASLMGKLSHVKTPRGTEYFKRISKLAAEARHQKRLLQNDQTHDTISE